MDGKSFIERLVLKNLLSYSDVGPPIELRPLNVLIGPNASGKSNLIEALRLLNAAPSHITDPIVDGGGINDWLWKGNPGVPTATIAAVVAYPHANQLLRYALRFGSDGQQFTLVDEVIEPATAEERAEDRPHFYRYRHGQPTLMVRTSLETPLGTTEGRTLRTLAPHDLKRDESVLAQRKDPDLYPELTYLGDQFNRIRFYHDWNFGSRAEVRGPHPADEYSDFLFEDAGNLSLVLNRLDQRSDTAERLLELLRKFYEPVTRITTSIVSGTVQVYLHERGLQRPIPATRLSDGTLRYLSLLAILLDPSPPPLVCLEEPELGLHPDILPTVADLLLDAAQRTQLIVTTHSEVLVSALSRVPEAVIICERDERGTQLRRLDAEQLQEWLEEYSLGQLWRMGQLGGNRW
jgi:predicted ATPase